MKTGVKYLWVTMHDNDFNTSLVLVGNLLQEIFKIVGNYPTESDLPIIKEMIKHMWYGTHNIIDKLVWIENYSEAKIECFGCHLEFVDYLDIPTSDNMESIYIPMFDGKILIR